MKAKFSGGPMNGKYQDLVSGYDQRLMVREPVNRLYDYYRDPTIDLMKFREGDYARSNMALKDGTVIYKWLGWRDNVRR